MSTPITPLGDGLVDEPVDPSGARRILRVTAGLGLSTVLVVLVSMVRTKVVATELGPDGVGLIALVMAASAPILVLFGFGIGTSGVQETARCEGAGDGRGRDETRWAVLVLSAGGAALCCGVLLLAAPFIAREIAGPGVDARDIRWLAVSLPLVLLSTSWMVGLNGLRRMRTIAKLGPIGAVAGTFAAVTLLLAGVTPILAVLVIPACLQVLVVVVAGRELPSMGPRPTLGALSPRMRTLLATGGAFVLQAIVTTGAILALRVIISNEEGRAQLGEFQAAFAIAETYLGFLLAAMALDYLPRLSALADRPEELHQAVNTQLTLGLGMAAPMITAMIIAAPVLISLFYTSAFEQSAELLRLQLLGELGKVVAWAIGFVLIAKQARVLFVAVEILHYGLFVGLTWFGVMRFGIESASIAYAVSYVVSIGWVLWFARRASGLRLSKVNRWLIALVALAGCATYASTRLGDASLPVGLALVATTTIVCAQVVLRSAGTSLRALLHR